MSGSLLALYAVVVGFNGSPAADVPALRYADDDAANYARLFRDAGAQVTLLTEYDADSRPLFADQPPDGPPTLAALTRAVESIPAGAEAFLVYTGHGDVAGGEGFVQLRGGRLTRSALYDRVLARLRTARAHVIVDACKSYFLVFERGPGGGERRQRLGHFVDARGPARFPNVGFLLSTSTATDSHEWEEFQAGLFSHEVRSALRGAADVDGDGRVSYAELGAFVRRANAAVPNARFRPVVSVVPPRVDAAGMGAQLLAWSSTSATARRLLVDLPVGRLYVEDTSGVRLLDANPGAGLALLLHLPAVASFVRADREFQLPPAPEVRLSTLAGGRYTVGRRGALHEAFRRLFERPFDRAAVDEFVRAPSSDPLADEGDAPGWRPAARRAAGLVAVGALAAGAGATIAALAVRGAIDDDASQSERASANDRIRTLNLAAIVGYGVAVGAGASWLVLDLWPDGGAARVAVPLR